MLAITVRVLSHMSEALAEEVERIFTELLGTRPEDPLLMVAAKLCEVEYLYEGGDVE